MKRVTIEEVTEHLINLLTDFSIHNLKHWSVSQFRSGKKKRKKEAKTKINKQTGNK